MMRGISSLAFSGPLRNCLDGSAGAPRFYNIDFEPIADQTKAKGAGLLSVD